MTAPTPRDRALAGEVVKVTDERLAELQRTAMDNEGIALGYMHWHWACAINELITARKEIERLTRERDSVAADARSLQERLQRAVDGAAKMREALERIARPGDFMLPAEIARVGLAAYPTAGPTPDDGPPGPKHPPRVPGHNPVG